MLNISSGLVWAGQGWSRLVKAGQGWSRLVKAGQGWSRLVKTGQDWSRLVKTMGHPKLILDQFQLGPPKSPNRNLISINKKTLHKYLTETTPSISLEMYLSTSAFSTNVVKRNMTWEGKDTKEQCISGKFHRMEHFAKIILLLHSLEHK